MNIREMTTNLGEEKEEEEQVKKRGGMRERMREART